MVMDLQDEGQDGRAERRVVAELLQVAAVLPFGPDGHLNETHQGEEGHRQTLGHQGEAEPRAQLQEEQTASQITNTHTHTHDSDPNRKKWVHIH